MFLIKGKMGTVLHTGDFRFHPSMLENPFLCPPERRNPEMRGISIDVDYLHLDNTFANSEYDFPSREEAYKSLKEIVDNHRKYRMFIFMYNLGKEEVFLNLAEDYDTKIVVDEDRMRKIKQMDLKPHLFTTDENSTFINQKGEEESPFIHIKQIKGLKNYDIEECNKDEPTIFIILTGWNDKYNRNLPFYFKVPYSSHSNYRELEKFVRAVCPKNLIFNVDDRAITEKRLEFQQYLMKKYVRREGGGKNLFNDPAKGIVRQFEDKDKVEHRLDQKSDQNKLPAGFGVNGDELLTERFNPNNAELNKKRFMNAHGHILNAKKTNKGTRGAKFTKAEVQLQLSDEDETSALKKPSIEPVNKSTSSAESKEVQEKKQGETIEELAREMMGQAEPSKEDMKANLDTAKNPNKRRKLNSEEEVVVSKEHSQN